MVAVLCVGLVGTSVGVSPPVASASPVSTWAEALARLLTREAEAAVPRRLPTLRSTELTELRASAERLIHEAPPATQLTAEQQAALRQVTVAVRLHQTLDGLDQLRASLSSDASEVAAGATNDGRLQAKLRDAATEILRDAACGSAFNLMTPQEKDAADESGESRLFDDAFVDPTSGAIEEFGQRVVARAFGPAALAVVEWEQYSTGIAEKIDRFQGTLDGQNTIELPSTQITPPPGAAPVMTKAFAYYARECLRPPG
jgi:hypothetical protein